MIVLSSGHYHVGPFYIHQNQGRAFVSHKQTANLLIARAQTTSTTSVNLMLGLPLVYANFTPEDSRIVPEPY